MERLSCVAHGPCSEHRPANSREQNRLDRPRLISSMHLGQKTYYLDQEELSLKKSLFIMSPQSHLSSLFTVLLVFVSLTNASLFSPFLSVLDWSQQTAFNETLHQVAKRAVDPTSCPTGYKNCANIGAPGLCCANSAICAPDQAGHVACCPSGAACTGSISSIITGGVIASGGSAVTTTTAASQPLTVSPSLSQTTATSGGGLIIASGHSTTATSPVTTTVASGATTDGGFVLVGSSTAATLGSSAVRNIHTVRLNLLSCLF